MPRFFKEDELTTWLPPDEIWMATARCRRAHILRGHLDLVRENPLAPTADNAVSLCGKVGLYEIFPIGEGGHLAADGLLFAEKEKA